MSAYHIAELLVAMAKAGEDGTVSTHGEPLPESGYYVGGKTPSLIFDNVTDVDRGEVGWWIGNNSSRFYGVWVDSDTGKIYFDAVTHMNYKSYALSVARSRGEIAVWDIANSKEIRVERADG